MEINNKTKEKMLASVLKMIEEKAAERQLKQRDLLSLCREKGYTLQQSELSRIFAHKMTLGLYPAIALCDVLDIDLERAFHPGKKRKDNSRFSDTFITDPDSDEIRSYIGKYNTIFHCTNCQEEKILKGTMEIYPDFDGGNRICAVRFSLRTGEHDIQGREIVKKYRGQFLVSVRMATAYIFLLNSVLGEINMIAFRHRTFFFRKVECRLGLALTSSAGERRVPAVHKFLISRKPIEVSQEEQIVHMLKLDNGEVLVEKNILRKIGKDKLGEKLYSNLEKYPTVEYVMLDRAALKLADRKMSDRKVAAALGELRKYSDEKYTLFLDESEDGMIYELLTKDNNEEYQDEIQGEPFLKNDHNDNS